jgi:hypothetical protein
MFSWYYKKKFPIFTLDPEHFRSGPSSGLIALLGNGEFWLMSSEVLIKMRKKTRRGGGNVTKNVEMKRSTSVRKPYFPPSPSDNYFFCPFLDTSTFTSRTHLFFFMCCSS